MGFQDRELLNLLARTAEGDEMALGSLYDRTSALVFGFALRVLGDPLTAEEVTMDVYMQVWQKSAQFDIEKGKPIVWLAMLTRSRAIDRLRVGQHQQSCQTSDSFANEEIDPGSNPEDFSVSQEQRQIVHQALASLSQEQRDVIELAYFKGLSQSEIASTLGEPVGTVKTRVRLGMMKLRMTLRPFEEDLASS